MAIIANWSSCGQRIPAITSAMATTCATILVFPSSLASMVYPPAAAIERNPETANSRPMIRITIHAGTR